MIVREINSPNYSDRALDAGVDMIVIHFTGRRKLANILNLFSNPKSQISAHYLIDDKGEITNLVGEDKAAWHTGVSAWRGKSNINSRSIGIELYNNGRNGFTEDQLSSLELLVTHLKDKYNIPAKNIVGHSDISPNRKIDPGHLFPWERLSKVGIGVWPNDVKDEFNAKALAKDKGEVIRLLSSIGYNTGEFSAKDNITLKGMVYNTLYLGKPMPSTKASYKQLVKAFQRHYEPELFTGNRLKVGKVTPKTISKMRALSRMMSLSN